MKQLALVGVLMAGGTALGQATFTGLGVLPYPSSQTYAKAISADGTTVVGYDQHMTTSFPYQRAFRWTRAGGMVDLGLLGSGPSSMDYAASADGSVVVGGSNDGVLGVFEAFRWTSAGGMHNLGWSFYSFAEAVNSDGTVVVGFRTPDPQTTNAPYATIWTLEGGTQSLSSSSSDATAVTPDGTMAAGNVSSPAGRQACIWSLPSGAVQLLGFLPGLPAASGVTAITPDGSAAVGWSGGSSSNFVFEHAFRWTAGGGMDDLGTLREWSTATGVSADGLVVVGYSSDSSTGGAESGVPFLWTPNLGMTNLNQYLPSLGISLLGWTLQGATGISSDGTTITGTGYHEGRSEAWIAVIPRPCGTADFDHDGDTGTDADIEAFFRCVAGNCCASCQTADFNGDGDAGTDADIEAFFRVLAGGNC